MAFIENGYQTLISFNTSPGLSALIKEKEVQPPELEVGDIDTTTMRSEIFRTKIQKSLISVNIFIRSNAGAISAKCRALATG